ncbi:MAG TPA: 2-amino-4-hydroxy-6-hydroxymethyldihydropteridine diphosphokinase [Rhizobiales bacterium]|nr:2-amino-4-hydroxy-6-hydroxymethyldihydropteridine diphosphokinase [Hyphomicrobiales bacterium]
MILVALGANVPGPWGTPRQTLERALTELGKSPCKLVKASTLITTKPFGVTDQPDFINAVAEITTELAPEALMAHLHDIELSADRRRSVRWGPRTLDLDLLDYNGLVLKGQGEFTGHQLPLMLPHPGIAERSFVLEPIAEIAPEWKHPVKQSTAAQMLQQLG